MYIKTIRNALARCRMTPRPDVMKSMLKYFTLIFTPLMLAACHGDIDGILNPKGVITYEERLLMFDAMALMLIVVIPVIIMSFAFVHRYRTSKRSGEYRPNWSHSVFLESIWWGVPCVIIVLLGILTWKSSHTLDPYRKIDGHDVSLRINVVALPWKWLFIYPEQNIATVNYLQLPKNKQVEFWLTTDNVPMSAFFVPQLGSQIYTMAGMRTKLHLLATEAGVYRGLNSQYNGDGFSDMHFPVHVVEANEMDAWFAKVKASPERLDATGYQKVRQATIGEKAHFYASVEPSLFQDIIKSYMMPAKASMTEQETTEKE